MAEEKKRGRGRPPVFTVQHMTALAKAGHFHGIETTKGRQDRAYALRAWELVQDDFDCHWLSERWAILNELGRIENEDEVKTWAKKLSEDQPTAKVAGKILRNFRAGKNNSADIGDLAAC